MTRRDTWSGAQAHVLLALLLGAASGCSSSSRGAAPGDDSGAPDAGESSDGGIPEATVGDTGAGVAAPSCTTGGPGMSDCSSAPYSCCLSPEVTGGTYDRTYANSGSGASGEANPATISGFRLDQYEVTVGRFREFVAAWQGGVGWTPPAGSGKHTHLNGGSGLSVTTGGYESGWNISDNGSIAPTDAHLACDIYATWTSAAGQQERLPVNCVNWYEAYAFCIWDVGFLPSEAEWEYAAAGGGQQREYPWGSTDPGTSNQYEIYGCHYPSGSGPCTSVANLAPVGTAAKGAGLWGQLDLGGNVEEWNLDDYVVPYTPGQCTDCAYLTASQRSVLRGGNYLEAAATLLPPYRDASAPNTRSGYYGFRCARVP